MSNVRDLERYYAQLRVVAHICAFLMGWLALELIEAQMFIELLVGLLLFLAIIWLLVRKMKSIRRTINLLTMP